MLVYDGNNIGTGQGPVVKCTSSLSCLHFLQLGMCYRGLIQNKAVAWERDLFVIGETTHAIFSLPWFYLWSWSRFDMRLMWGLFPLATKRLIVGHAVSAKMLKSFRRLRTSFISLIHSHSSTIYNLLERLPVQYSSSCGRHQSPSACFQYRP